MKYEWKRAEEAAWVAAVAAGIALLEVLVRFDAEAVTDYKLWAVSLGGSMIRAAAGAAMAFISRPR